MDCGAFASGAPRAWAWRTASGPPFAADAARLTSCQEAFSPAQTAKTRSGPGCPSSTAPPGIGPAVRAPDGSELAMHGTYRELSPPERSVHTEGFDGLPGESLVTSTFTERNGETTLLATIRYASKAIRDAVISSGMEHGAAESYDKLAELLAATEELPALAEEFSK